MLVHGLDLGRDDEEETDFNDGVEEGVKTDNVYVLMDDTEPSLPGMKALPLAKGTNVNRGNYADDEDENSDGNLSMGSAFSPAAPGAVGDTVSTSKVPTGPSSQTLSDLFEKKSRSNDLFNYVFTNVAGKKG